MSQDILTSTFVAFRSALRRTAARIVGSDDGAEDVLHDAFCRLWSRHPRVADRTEAIKISYVAVRNTAIDEVRRSGRCLTVPVDEVMPVSDVEDSDDSESIYDAVMEISRGALNMRQFEVFKLHDIDGWEYPEIAARLGITNDNVRTILSRARKTIREIYRQKYERL